MADEEVDPLAEELPLVEGGAVVVVPLARPEEVEEELENCRSNGFPLVT